MGKLKIRNWEKWQSYRADRGQPPWIKVHRRVMRNIEWVSLTDAERGQLVSIWLLAADHDGVIPASPELIQKLCYMTDPPNINKFIDLGFICYNDVNQTPGRRQNVTPKAEAEKNREEKNSQQADFFKNNNNPYFKSIEKSCKMIGQTKHFNPYSFVNKAVNKWDGHIGAVDEILRLFQTKRNSIASPWAWCKGLFNKKNGNYWERENMEDHEKLKDEFKDFVNNSEKIQNLVAGIGTNVLGT